MRDLGETECGTAQGYFESNTPHPTEVVVFGPDKNDKTIGLYAAQEIYLPPAVAMKLYQELGFRLRELGYSI